MERIDKMLNHDLLLENLGKNEKAEANRRFCRHNMVHFLDVARIARIMNCEEQLGIELPIIYAAALLHDIGKHRQYAEGIPHEKASAEIAPVILMDCGFDDKEAGAIIGAILNHRNKEVAEERNLNGLLYRADKASRSCFACEAEAECNWSKEKKNLSLKY